MSQQLGNEVAYLQLSVEIFCFSPQLSDLCLALMELSPEFLCQRIQLVSLPHHTLLLLKTTPQHGMCTPSAVRVARLRV